MSRTSPPGPACDDERHQSRPAATDSRRHPLRVPVAPRSRPDGAPLRPRSLPAATPLRILVVSRDPATTVVVGQVIEHLGHGFELCGEPVQALDRMRQNPPPLVIVDAGLDFDSAAAIVGGLRQPAVGGRSYVIVIAPLVTDANFEAVLSVGADDFILRPFSAFELGFRIGIAAQRLRENPRHRETRRPVAGLDRNALASLEPIDGWWEWDLRTGVVAYSSTWKAMVGQADDELTGSPEDWLRLVHPDDIEPLRTRLEDFVGGRAATFEHGHRLRLKDGSYRWLLTRGVAIHGDSGAIEQVIGLQTDVTAQLRIEQRVDFDATHDPLTGLPNRALFLEQLHMACVRAARRPEVGFAVFFLDVDRFKKVNDSLGHLAGDQLLRAIAARLESVLRPNDPVARFGGDEFVILIDDIEGARAALDVAARVQQEFRKPFDINGLEVFASASLGIALWGFNCRSAEDLLRAADTAMYRAKALGTNRVAVFDEDMYRDAVAELMLENDLRRAVENQEFEVLYQPIVDLGHGTVTGFEALVRWRHPERGLVPPAEFIPLAEEIGVITQIDRWVLEQACQQLRSWQVRFRRSPPLTINVNISGGQFVQPDVVAHIDHVLRKTGLFGSSLNLEITESLIMSHAGYAGAMLEQLKRLEIGICIDDFGTGYSSFSYLREFDIDTLKIDRSFVAEIGSQPESLQIVRTIAALASALGKVTVIEGIEDDVQLELVRSMKPDRIQGYRVSVPLSASDAEEWLERASLRGMTVAGLSRVDGSRE